MKDQDKKIKKEKFSLKHLQWNAENVWLGKGIFKFYHDQKCAKCNYCCPGYNDLNSDGPWHTTCPKCGHQWTVSMLTSAKEDRKKLLHIFKSVDSLIDQAISLQNRRYVIR